MTILKSVKKYENDGGEWLLAASFRLWITIVVLRGIIIFGIKSCSAKNAGDRKGR